MTIISVSYNDNTIRTQITVQEDMMKPLNVTLNLLYRVSWSQKIKIILCSLKYSKLCYVYII
jgi:hypothetical protein